MGSIGFWNVRGFNSGNKQSDVRRFMHLNNAGFFGILETRLRRNSINKVHNRLGKNWSIVTNIDAHEGVKFGWIAERIPLWDSFIHMHAVVNGPWVVMGDFNNVLAMNERIGSETTNAELRGFQECVATCGLMDTPAQGAFFTWNNKHEVGDMVFSRIDRVLINNEWLPQFPDVSTTFHPEGLYDHCPCTITLWPVTERKKGSFKFFNMWEQDAAFFPTVKSIWDDQIEGYTMFQIVKKLKALKFPLKALNESSFANIETSAKVALIHMHEA
ncbi:uncharacterized protein LOC141651897 [Silene latifolia]|uniref:uncharacterized protein LOC141651897 n=1 Tax=Silene latifolia TaxID=37657 RepID=UPI003D77AE81